MPRFENFFRSVFLSWYPATIIKNIKTESVVVYKAQIKRQHALGTRLELQVNNFGLFPYRGVFPRVISCFLAHPDKTWILSAQNNGTIESSFSENFRKWKNVSNILHQIIQIKTLPTWNSFVIKKKICKLTRFSILHQHTTVQERL